MQWDGAARKPVRGGGIQSVLTSEEPFDQDDRAPHHREGAMCTCLSFLLLVFEVLNRALLGPGRQPGESPVKSLNPTATWRDKFEFEIYWHLLYRRGYTTFPRKSTSIELRLWSCRRDLRSGTSTSTLCTVRAVGRYPAGLRLHK